MRWSGDRFAAVVVAALVLLVTWAPVFGFTFPVVLQLLATLAALLVLVAGFGMAHGGRRAFALLWLASGLLVWLAAITMFSLPGVYLVAAAAVLLVVALTPNNTGLAFRWDRRFIMTFGAGLFAPWLLFLVPIV